MKGLVWIGGKPWDFDGMTRFLGEALGLEVSMDQESAVVYEMPDGTAFEVFKPHDDKHDPFSPPVAGLLVDDVPAARRHMETHGVEFIGDIRYGVAGENWGTAWSHFRAPDGNRYVLISRPDAHPGGQPRRFDELRVVLRVDDIEAATRVYRDALGLPIVEQWERPTGGRGVLFAVCPASIELFNDAQWQMVDEGEVGAVGDSRFALRFEVDDPRAAAEDLASAGVSDIAPYVETHWGHTVVRATPHDGVQLTLFTLPEEERARRARDRRLLPR